jgi:elongation factor Ts
VNVETDFAAKGELFQNFVKNLSKIVTDIPIDSTDRVVPLALERIMAAQYASPQDGSLRPVADLLSWLRFQIGEAITIRRAARLDVTEGQVFNYTHGIGRFGSLVAIRARGGGGGASVNIEEHPAFQSFGSKLAVHVVGYKARYLTSNEITEDSLTKLRETDPNFDLDTFKKETVLLEQDMVVGEDQVKPIKAVLVDLAKQTQVSSIEIVSFLRWKNGEDTSN